MSYFPSKSAALQEMEHQVELFALLHNSASKQCQLKCIPTDYHEGNLNKGESLCLDRCVAKFVGTGVKLSSEQANHGFDDEIATAATRAAATLPINL
ncbi:mitochondrial import inner membrane translocase subunit Tim10-like protein [Gorgonomyces haynaldii]|nr:mitochondrial import inner membrane translocase subunit Tim10-like protein [Gorgonomyces haynaldii]